VGHQRGANYTHAYTTFTVRSVLNPDIPNNHGSLAPIRMEAPEGSIVNAVRPQPGTARHVVGMFLPNALLKALAQVRPDQAMAEGSGAVWTMQVSGNHDDGSPFITAMFTYAGGVGARAAKPGLDACSYPTGVAAVPIEVVEASAPIRFPARRCAPVPAARRHPGGLGQTIEFTVDTTRDWQLNAVTSRLAHAPEGIFGGEAGSGRHVQRQRRGRHHPGAHHPAARRRRAPRPAGRRRVRRPPGGSPHDDPDSTPARHPRRVDRDVAEASTLPSELYTSPEFSRSSARRCSRTSGCASGAPSASPNPGDWFTVTICDEPIVVVRDKGPGRGQRLSAVCQHRAMQVCDGQGNSPRSSARTTTGSTASTAACSARRRWSAPRASRRSRLGPAALPSSCGRASCS
jgi:hypothetical protein